MFPLSSSLFNMFLSSGLLNMFPSCGYPLSMFFPSVSLINMFPLQPVPC
jgi:hypothetical protein